jgi:hypothetical protein
MSFGGLIWRRCTRPNGQNWGSMDYKVFKSRADAEAEIATMRGWAAKAVQIYWPGHVWAKRGYVWVVSDGDKFLRLNGFVE